MNDFTVVDVAINSKLAGLIERESGVKPDSINSIVGFDEGSIYDGNTQRLSGIIVVTGPVLKTHIFTRAGLTYKYRGFADIGPYGGVWTDQELGVYLMKHHEKQFPAFQQCLNSIMSAVIATSTKTNEQE